ncbi:hypothetical protein BGZ50_009850 [Haplosporangium sp. Z 11]|nr:hypothetical protein BGZ50_009850 [Haplosporangium sp. Z 11]
MMSNGDEVKKRPLESLESMNSQPNGDTPSLTHDIPEEGPLKKLKAEDDDRVPFSSPAPVTVPSTTPSEHHPLVPSLDHTRADLSAAPRHSTSDRRIDSDMSVPNSLLHAPTTNVLSVAPAPAPVPTVAAALTVEPRNPDDIEVSKPMLQPFTVPTAPALPTLPLVSSDPNPTLTPVNPTINGNRKPTITREQLKYCSAIIKQLKRHRDAPAFLHPVDPVLLKIPDYPLVVKNPMDLSTVERKLNDVEYDSVDDFVQDINLIFSNCYLYNGREAPVSICASNLESAFMSSLRHMPKENSKPSVDSVVQKDSTKKAPAAPRPKKEPVKKEDSKLISPVSATSSDHALALSLSRAASEERRPKRDIHAPSKEIPTAIAVKKKGSAKWKADAQLRYCHSILREFSKKANAEFMFPFMEPVDWVKLNIPDYPKIIKNPMDLSTVRQKLEDDEYENAAQFESDIRLILWNCFKFNPAGTPVHIMGRRMEKLFNDKWEERPPPPTPPVVEENDADSESEEDSSDEKIAEMERHLKTLAEKLKQMKATKKKEKSEKKSSTKAPQERPSKPKTASKSPAKAPAKSTVKPASAKASVSEKKKAPVKRSKPVYSSSGSSSSSSEEDVPMITFEQKKELSDSINNFAGDKLANVVQIIHNSMPHLRDHALVCGQ